MAEHDSSYKLLFSHSEMVADLIRGFVREDWVEELDFSTLERVSETSVSHDLREREDDLIWRLRWGGRWLYVYLLLEFQSSVDRFMAVRLLTYIGLLYQDLAAAGEIPRGGRLPPVLPIVLYNGEADWWAAASLDELGEPDLPAQLRRYQPRFRYLLLEEHRYDDAELVQLGKSHDASFQAARGFAW
jgi:predicted transposase YdaD